MSVRLAAATLLLVAPAFACSCGDASASVCANIADLQDTRYAIFTGRVIDFYPLDALAAYRDAAKQIALEPRLSVGDRYLAVYQKIWGDALTQADREAIAAVKDAKSAKPFADLLGAFKRRARFQVTERFSGPETTQFEAFTGMGYGDCGINFEIGQTYLVWAYRLAGASRWETFGCTPTRRIESDRDPDVEMLRTGIDRVPKLVGKVLSVSMDNDVKVGPLPDFSVRLRSGSRTEETRTNSRGQFTFQQIPSGTYSFELVEPRWGPAFGGNFPITVVVDDRSRCTASTVLLKRLP